jgi:hypothetical protein
MKEILIDLLKIFLKAKWYKKIIIILGTPLFILFLWISMCDYGSEQD